MSPPPSSLWLTLPAPSPLLAILWVGWLAVAALLAPVLAPALGTVGVGALVVVLGVWLAHLLPSPQACLRVHHVDDLEVVRLGPGRAVMRLAWTDVTRCTQGRHALVVGGEGVCIALPLPSLAAGHGWAAVLTRVVPRRADALWDALEAGAVVLAPAVDPDPGRAAVWCWGPAVAAAASLGDAVAAGVMLALAALERAVVHVRRRLRTVVLQPGGLVVAGRQGRFFAPWDDVSVESVPAGLVVQSAGGTGLVPLGIDDFWAVAAVIELRSQLGYRQPDTVRFRVQVDGADIAVVGEIDAA